MAAGEYLPPVVTRLSMELKEFLAGVETAKAALKSLSDTTIHIDVDMGNLLARVAEASAAVKSIPDRDINIKVDQGGLDGIIAAAAKMEMATEAANGFAAAMKDLNTAVTSNTVRMRSNQRALAEWAGGVAAMQGELYNLYDLLTQINDEFDSLAKNEVVAALAGAAASAAEADRLRAQNDLLITQIALLETRNAAAGGGGQGRGLPGWGGFLTGTVTTWAGAFAGSSPFPAMTASVKLWHIALDGSLETVVALTGALIDLGAATATLAPSAVDIYNRFTAMRNVADSLNNGVTQIDNNFRSLVQGNASKAITMFGGLITLMHQSNSSGVINQTVNGLNNWITKLDLYMGAQHGANTLMVMGTGFLHQFEQVVNNTGVALTGLIRADPGTAHFLMDVVVGATEVVKWVGQLNPTFLKVAIGIHSFLIWGGLLYSWAVRLIGMLPVLGGRLAAVLAIPEVAAAVAVVGLLAYSWDRASNAARGYINTQNSTLSNMGAQQAFNTIPTQVRDLYNQIDHYDSLTMPKIKASWNQVGSTINSFTKDTRADLSDWYQALYGNNQSTTQHWLELGRAIKGIFVPGQGQQIQKQVDVQAFENQVKTLSTQDRNLYQNMGDLVKGGMNVSQAWAVMNLAGVQNTDTIAQMRMKVQNLLQGYKALGLQGNLLENSINAVTFGTQMQEANISAITQAWTGFITIITGGATAFDTFQQGMLTTGTDVKAAGASMNGLNAASLTLNSQFYSNISNANALINSLMTLAAAGSAGAKGQQLVMVATKAAAQEMLPLAKTSKTAQDALYAFAQQGGYPGADSIKALSQWIGNFKNPAATMQTAIAMLTHGASNLTKDVATLADTINPILNNAMEQAIFSASGGAKAMDNLANAVINNQGNSKLLSSDFTALYRMTMTMYHGTGQARDQFIALVGALGISQSAAKQLWTALSGNGSAVARAHATASAIQAAINSIHGKTITVTTVLNTVKTGIAAGGVGRLTGYASGTAGAARGWAWVGERGPELVRFNGGESVIPSHVATGYAGGAGYEPADQHVHVYLDGKKIYSQVQKQAVTAQRRTGFNGLTKRTR